MVGQNYGNSQGVQMDAAPSHAAMVHDEAVADGVNPYSGEPAMPQYNISQRFSAAPIVVAGPHHVNSSQPTGISQGSGNLGSYNASRTAYSTSAASPAYYEHESVGQPTMADGPPGNGSAKGDDRMGAAYGQHQQHQQLHGQNGQNGQNGQIPRPGFQGRTDSTPHVPGEYPRGTPMATPNVY